jgi:hypothetical protein
MKLCKDCKHIELPIKTFSKCTHPKNMTINAVTGESEFKLSAGVQRIGDSFFSWFSGNCGKSARWFEPARERPL